MLTSATKTRGGDLDKNLIALKLFGLFGGGLLDRAPFGALENCVRHFDGMRSKEVCGKGQ